MRILLVGHSLIEWGDWPRLLPGHETANLGISGETTAGLLGRLDGVLRAHPGADAVVVMSGTNDLLAENGTFLHEYRSVARRLRRAYPGARVLLHAVPPISPDWVSPAAVARANERIASIAAECGVEFLDLTGRLGGPGGEPRAALYEGDGVHLSPRGYAVWAEALLAALGAPG
jgi:lysophospholipase L1-like esterase